ncbi:UNVERIFIED_CONTAM: hypothetical protein Sradi_0362800 [Sesamum radiatum]|uniref:Protein yippee-like n=1 Tax=Sesamum radiatum TaxID=300843 RepID=A0AAW2W484_SESRA
MTRTGFVLVKFDEEFPDYYMCKSCRTHIALADDLDSFDAGAELSGAMFRRAVNIKVDHPDHYREVAGCTVADIYCVKCNNRLGWQYVLVNGSHIPDRYYEHVRLKMKKLVRKYSTEILDAETMSPVRED